MPNREQRRHPDGNVDHGHPVRLVPEDEADASRNPNPDERDQRAHQGRRDGGVGGVEDRGLHQDPGRRR